MSTTTRTTPKSAAAADRISNRKVAAPAPAPQPAPQPSTESFIVQHIGQGYHYVSDLGEVFGPFEVRDLTGLDSSLLRRSRDLKQSLQLGNLIRITEEEADQILQEESDRLRAQTVQSARKRQLRSVQAGDRTLDAEMINLSQADSGNYSDEINSMSRGTASDHVSYAMAFQAARAEAVEYGQVPPTPREFANRVANNSSLVSRYVTSQNGVTSGDPTRARATVLTPPSSIESGMGIQQMRMSNFNRDQFIAGQSDNGIGSYRNEVEDLPVAEMIDLLDEDDDADMAGSIRRR